MVSAGAFAGRAVIVTGAAGGIGGAVADAFAACGARLMLVDRAPIPAERLDALRAAGADDVISAACDIADEGQVADAARRTVESFGRLDVVVNVAGQMIYRPIAELTAADWRALIDVNLIGAALFTGEALRRMGTGGAIVNVASVHARQTSPLVAPYAAAKAALESLTRSTAIEGRAAGIRANAVLPGAIDTPMLWASPNIASGAETIAPEDVGAPADVAGAVLYLASPAAAFVTGASLLVDGGRLARL